MVGLGLVKFFVGVVFELVFLFFVFVVDLYGVELFLGLFEFLFFVGVFEVGVSG